MNSKGQISTLTLVIGIVVLIVVALALIMVVTGRIQLFGKTTGGQVDAAACQICETQFCLTETGTKTGCEDVCGTGNQVECGTGGGTGTGTGGGGTTQGMGGT